MNNLEFLIPGDKPLDEINEIISDQEEQYNCEFKDSIVVTQGTAMVNQVTFIGYLPNQVPNLKKLILQVKGQPPPPKSTRFWTGEMIAANNKIDEEAYRED